MPHYGLNTQLNEKDMKKLDAAKKLTKETTYKFLRKAVTERCERVLKEGKETGSEKNGKTERSDAKSGRQEALTLNY